VYVYREGVGGPPPWTFPRDPGLGRCLAWRFVAVVWNAAPLWVPFFFQRHTPNRLVFKSMLKQFVTADVPGDNETKERWVVDRAKGYQHTLKKTEPFWLRHLVKGFALMESQDVIDINELGSQLKRKVVCFTVK